MKVSLGRLGGETFLPVSRRELAPHFVERLLRGPGCPIQDLISSPAHTSCCQPASTAAANKLSEILSKLFDIRIRVIWVDSLGSPTRKLASRCRSGNPDAYLQSRETISGSLREE